jgi:hypothetical protein
VFISFSSFNISKTERPTCFESQNILIGMVNDLKQLCLKTICQMRIHFANLKQFCGFEKSKLRTVNPEGVVQEEEDSRS